MRSAPTASSRDSAATNSRSSPKASTKRPESEALAARILEALGQPMWIAGRELFPSASIGIALWQPRYRLGEELLRDADAAMYRAKARRARPQRGVRRGACARTRCACSTWKRTCGARSSAMRSCRISSRSCGWTDGAVIGHEALLRWNHELHGALPPSEFIGVGEDSGLIEQVDWLLYERVIGLADAAPARATCRSTCRRGISAPTTSPSACSRLLDAAGADPRRLRIEITEVALLDDAPRALRTLNTLRERGVLALLDDFGTGFSALSYLHRFPIQSLKIDRSFVAGLDGETRAESLALVRAILALAGTLGIETIGEGIESLRQRDRCWNWVATIGQGYLLRPARSTTPSSRRPLAEAGVGGATSDRVADHQQPRSRSCPRSRSGCLRGPRPESFTPP